MHETDDQSGQCELGIVHGDIPCHNVETFDVELKVEKAERRDRTFVDGDFVFTIGKQGKDEKEQHLISFPATPARIVPLTNEMMILYGMTTSTIPYDIILEYYHDLLDYYADWRLATFTVEPVADVESHHQCIVTKDD